MTIAILPCGRCRRLARALLGPWHAVFLLLAVLIAVSPSAVRAQVDTLETLLSALATARGGETIRLAGGTYGKLEVINGRQGVMSDFASEVTIVAADPANPPVFSGVDLRGGANLTFDGVVFDYAFAPDHPVHLKPFYFEEMRNLTIRNSLVHGDLAREISAEEDGLPWAQGLNFNGGSNITIENVEITLFHRGMVMGGVDGATIRNNDLHGIRVDGMDFVQMQDTLIEGNHIHDFNRSRLRSDHSDMIQFWTRGSTRPSINIIIRGNLLNSGIGSGTQSIFMRNEEVDNGRAGEEMFYQDILIEENVIINGHLHGITVGETDGLTIRRNTLLRNQNSARGENRGRTVTIPGINIAGSSKNVAILDNIAARFPEPAPDRWVEGNLQVQDISPLQPGYYHRLFAAALLGDPRELENFIYLPEVGLGRPNGDWPGASLLRPGADRSAFR